LQDLSNRPFRLVKSKPQNLGTDRFDRCHSFRFARHVAERITTVDETAA
jgi:hypothetical protein